MLITTIVLAGWQAFNSACASDDGWRAAIKAAQLAEFSHKTGAAAAYEQAIALMPPEILSERLKALGALSTILLQERSYDKAYTCVQDIIKTAQRMKASAGRLDGDSLVMISNLCEECTVTIGEREDWKKRKQLFTKFMPLALALDQFFDLRAEPIQSRRFSSARAFVVMGFNDLTEKQLVALVPYLHPNTEFSWNVKCALAAVQARSGRDEGLKHLRADLLRHFSEAGALRRIANGQLWTADYPHALENAQLALKRVTQSPGRRDIGEEVEINLLLAGIHGDMGQLAKSEPYLKRAYELVEKDPQFDQEAKDKVRQRLTGLLRSQHHDAEAKKLGLSTDSLSEFDSWLTDDEKAAVEKDRKKRAAQPSAKPAGASHP